MKFNNLKELFDYCTVCKQCKKKLYMDIQAPDDFILTSQEILDDKLNLTLIYIEDIIDENSLNDGQLRKTLRHYISLFIDINTNQLKAESEIDLNHIKHKFLFVSSSCDKCYSLIESQDINFSDVSIESISIEYERYFIDNFAISKDYYKNTMSIHDYISKKRYKLPIYNFDLFAPNAKDKIKTILNFQ